MCTYVRAAYIDNRILSQIKIFETSCHYTENRMNIVVAVLVVSAVVRVAEAGMLKLRR